jgi:hypothetical protein
MERETMSNQEKITDQRASNDNLTRFLGGTPLAVLGRLVLLSILIGFVLHAFGLNPFNIIESIRHLIRSVWELGFDALNWLWRYFLLGAVIVIPIWFILRIVNAPRGR